MQDWHFLNFAPSTIRLISCSLESRCEIKWTSEMISNVSVENIAHVIHIHHLAFPKKR